jgi:hypothetical protein
VLPPYRHRAGPVAQIRTSVRDQHPESSETPVNQWSKGGSNPGDAAPMGAKRDVRSPKKTGESSRNGGADAARVSASGGATQPELVEVELESAIIRLTHAMAAAEDDDILDLVAERKDLRAQLAELRNEASGVARLDAARAKRLERR